jgi:hypothetical protein
MNIDGDTHYWPLRFIDKVSHPGQGIRRSQKRHKRLLYSFRRTGAGRRRDLLP